MVLEGSLSFQHQSISIPYIFSQMLCDFTGFKTCFWHLLALKVGVSKITLGGGHVPFQIKQEQQQGPRNLGLGELAHLWDQFEDGMLFFGEVRFSNNLSLLN